MKEFGFKSLILYTETHLTIPKYKFVIQPRHLVIINIKAEHFETLDGPKKLHSWDKKEDLKLPACNKIQDLLDYEKLSTDLSLLDREDVVAETGLQVPCK